MRRIKKTFQTVTPESAKDNDYAETGWENEEGTEINPDECDIEEHEGELGAIVALAKKEILSEGCVEASSSQFHPGVWYTSIDPNRDYSDGSETTYSFHLDGFLPEEEEAIYKEIA